MADQYTDIIPPSGPQQRVSVSYEDAGVNSGVGFKDVAAAVPLSIIGGLDTTVSSMSFGAISNTAISDTLLDNAAGHAAGLYEMYKEREDGYKMAGDIAALFVGVGAATKIFRAGEYAVKGAKAAGLLQSVDEAAAIGGYIGGTAETLAAARTAAQYGKSAPSTLEIARAMFKARDAELGAHALVNLERTPERTQALRNLYKIGAAQAVGELAAGEAASYLLLNQSQALYPEGMTLKDWALMTSAVGGLMVAGTVARSAWGTARSSAREAGMISAKADAAAGAPTIAAAVEDEFGVALKFEKRDANRMAREAPDVDPIVRADNAAQATTWDLALATQLDNIAGRTSWAGGVVKLSSEMNNTLREALDASTTRGLRHIQYSSDIIGKQKQLTTTALTNANDELAKLRQLPARTVAQNDRAVELSRQVDDISSAVILHVNADGVHLVEGEMPRHLGVTGMTSSYTKYTHGGEWAVGAKYGENDATVIVSAKFTTNIDDFSKADLLTVNKASAAFNNMLQSPSLHGEVAAISGIDITKMTGNSPAVDAVIKYIDKLPNDAERTLFMQRLNLPRGVQQRDQLEDWAIAQKADALIDWLRNEAKSNIKNKTLKETTPYELSLRFGLGLHTQDGGASPLLEALQGAAATSKTKLPNGLRSVDGLKSLAASAKTLGKIGDVDGMNAARASIDVKFDRIGYNFKERPVALIRSATAQQSENALTARDMMRVGQKMRDEKLERSVTAAREQLGFATDDYPLAGGLVDALNASNKTQEFAKIRDYVETTAAMVNQSQAEMNPILQGMTTRAYQMDNIVGAPVIQGMMRPFAKTVDAYQAKIMAPAVNAVRELAKPENLAHRYAMNSYYAAMQLKLPVLEGFDDLGRVLLNHGNPATAKMWETLTGVKFDPAIHKFVPDPSQLTKGQLAPLRVTNEAREAIVNIQHLTKDVLVNKNALRYTNGANLIADRPHYVPYVQQNNQHMAIIADQTGKPRAQVSGATLEAVEKAAADRITAMKKLDPGAEYYATSTRDIVRYKQAHGEAASEFLYVTEGASKGELANLAKVDDTNNYVTALLAEIQSEYRGIAVDHIKTNFKEALSALNFNKTASDVAKTIEPKSKQVMLDDAFTLFQEALTGYQTPKPGAWTARLDDMSYGVLNWAGETAAGRLTSNFMTGVGAMFDRVRGRHVIDAQWMEMAKKLENEHGFAPFTNAVERAQASGAYQIPNDVKDIMRKGNALAAYTILQLGEASQAFMNLTNAFVMGPAQLRVIKRMHGESEAAHQLRIGNLGGVHGDVVLPNEHGALINGMKALGNPEFKAYYQKFGEVPHEEGLLLNMLSNTNDAPTTVRSWWSKFFNQQAGYLTAPSRAGDRYGALISHAIAWDYMKRSGIDVGRSLTQAYADNLARKIITVTGPQDKANFYRTIPGLPLGLFQSFTNNYIQHLMRMVEDGDTRRFLAQYTTQGMAYGLHSVPGWTQFNDTMFRNWDGSSDIDGNLEKNMGRTLYDLAMHGPLWSAPKLFGADGLGMYTRGDANIRMSLGQIGSPMDLPANQVRAKMVDMLVQAARGVAGKDDAWEALVRSIPNRPIKGLMESMQGYATDRSGQITFDRTADWGSAFTRLLGLKTMTEIEAARATFKLKDIETAQRSAKTKLRAEAMAAIRSGNVDEMNRFAEDYIRYGGRPETFSRWFQDVLVRASAVRYDTDLQKAMKKASSLRELQALGDAMTNR